MLKTEIAEKGHHNKYGNNQAAHRTDSRAARRGKGTGKGKRYYVVTGKDI